MNPGGAGERAWARLVAVVTPRRRPPPVSIELDRAVPAWALRLVIAMVATGCGLLMIPNAAYWVIAVPLIAAMAAWPGGNAPVYVVLGAGLLLLTSASEPFGLDLHLLVFSIHLAVEIAAALGDVPWSAPVEVRILTRASRRFVLVQLAGQAVTFLGAWATSYRPSLAWLPLVAGVALAAVGWGVLASLRSNS